MKPNCINAPNKPGMLIWHCGRIDFQGNSTFVGILYIVNNSDGTCDRATKSGNARGNQPADRPTSITTNGGFGVWGAVASTAAAACTSAPTACNIKFNGNVCDAVNSYGTVGLVQNTWRELKAGLTRFKSRRRACR